MTDNIQITHLDPRSLTANPFNFRRHPEYQKDALGESIEDHGWLATVLYNRQTGHILDGHARVEYAIDNELPTVPCIVIDVPESQEKRILAQFDRITYLAEEDDTMLAQLLAEIVESGDKVPMGYDDERVDALLASLKTDVYEPLDDEGERDPEEDIIPDEDKVPSRCEALDLWRLGDHFLFVGDSTNPAHRKRLFRNAKMDVVHADPPYGIDLKPTWSKTKGRYEAIEGDDQAFDPAPFLTLAPAVLMWGANHFADRLPASSFWICWDKQGMELHRDHADCEFAWVNVSKPARVVRHVWDGFRRDSEQGEKRVHPTQKPVKLIEDVFQWLGGTNVFEPFAGSGTTILACERMKKVCFAMELDPKYGDVILARYEMMTGVAPELVERGT